MARTMPDWVTVTSAKPATGSLSITSSPGGASFYLNGDYKGTTPLTLSGLTPASYTGKFTMNGYADVTQSVIVRAGQTMPCTATLVKTATPATGSISVSSTPSGAVVIVDGTQQAGTTPLTVTNQNPGSHAVVVRKSDYSDYMTNAQVTAGQTVTVNAPLTKTVPATGSLQVISTPDGAVITIDGGPQGTTPKTLSGLAAGSHTVKLTKSGYTDYQATVSVVAGKTTQLTVPLVNGNGPSPTATSTKNSPASTGSISVSSSPSGAGINLDGWEKGKTPATLDQVKAGSHTLTLSLAGYADRILTVPVESGKVTTVSSSLIPHPSSTLTGSGMLVVRSDPAGANVYLDGEKVGNTPVQLQGVKAGTHNLLLTMSGYGDVTRTIEMASGSDKDVSIDLGIKAPGFGLPLALAALLVVTLLLVRKRKRW